MKARYSASLPEPFEIALQCLQFEKKVFVWKSITRGDSQSDRGLVPNGTLHVHLRSYGLDSHMLRLQCVCGPCALRMMFRSSTDSLCFHTVRVCSLLLIRGCLPQTQHLSIILISNPNVVSLPYTERAWAALWSSFITVQLHNLS